MTNEILIEVRKVSKIYKVAASAASKVINAFIPTYQRGITDFWALKNVSVQVKRGESVAIIGKNGSGKSTLLEIITGTRKPTSGEVVIKGSVAALLQLGSGFNPEFTGRENIVLSGLIFGLSRKEIETKFDEIVAFADIGSFIEQPVKNYSSGMLVRLAFSVQVALEPDILIIDEALSVGDFFFRQKCATRMRELQGAGTTLLFVSHSLASVKEICDRAIVLQSGELMFSGDSNKAIRYYLSAANEKIESKNSSSEYQSVESSESWENIVRSEGALMWKSDSANNTLGRGGLLGVSIICNENGTEPLIAFIGEERTFRIYFRAFDEVPVVVQIIIKDKFGALIFGADSAGQGYAPFTAEEPGIICFDFSLKLLLSQGGYSFQCMLKSQEELKSIEGYESLMRSEVLGPLQVKKDKKQGITFRGKVGLPTETRLKVVS